MKFTRGQNFLWSEIFAKMQGEKEDQRTELDRKRSDGTS
jgi:hypothetical protein